MPKVVQMKKIFLIAVMLSASAAVMASQAGLPFEVVRQGFGVRAAAMGEAATADSFDSTAIFWNPALLDGMSKNEIFASYESLYGGAHYDNIAYATPLGKIGALGMDIAYLSYGNFDIVDAGGVSNGQGSYADTLVTASYGKSLPGGLLAGAALKALIKGVDTNNYIGFSGDLSVAKNIDFINIGLTLKNLIPFKVTYETSSEVFSPSVRLGLSGRFFNEKLIINADAEKIFAGVNAGIYAGAEYNVWDPIYIRAGAALIGDANELSGGFGVKINDFGFDYAATFNDLLIGHKVALTYSFGGYGLSIKPEPEIFSPIGGNRKTYLRAEALAKYDIFKWKVEIKNSKGEIVKAWEGAGKPDVSFVWDGLSKDGMPFDEGVYTVDFSITDENDKVIKAPETTVKISSSEEKSIPLYRE
jgi:hypothetical protein